MKHAQLINFLLSFALANLFTFQNTSFAQDSFLGYDIFVIAGQSNAVGMGTGSYVDDLKSETIDSTIFQIGRFQKNDLKIIPGTDVLQHFDYTDIKKEIGFGMAFARRYSKTMAKNRKVLLVPVAMRSTSILQWLSEKPAPNYSISLLADLKVRLSLAMKTQNSEGKDVDNRFIGLLWMQSETDIIKTALKTDGMNETVYLEKMNNLFTQILSDYPQEEVSLIVGEPSPAWNNLENKDIDLNPIKKLFRNKIIEWTNQSSNRRFVSSKDQGLTSNPQGLRGGSVHYDARSLIKLGQLFYDKYLEIKKY